MLPRNQPDGIQIAFDDHRLVNNAGLLLPITLGSPANAFTTERQNRIPSFPGKWTYKATTPL